MSAGGAGCPHGKARPGGRERPGGGTPPGQGASQGKARPGGQRPGQGHVGPRGAVVQGGCGREAGRGRESRGRVPRGDPEARAAATEPRDPGLTVNESEGPQEHDPGQPESARPKAGRAARGVEPRPRRRPRPAARLSGLPGLPLPQRLLGRRHCGAISAHAPGAPRARTPRPEREPGHAPRLATPRAGSARVPRRPRVVLPPGGRRVVFSGLPLPRAGLGSSVTGAAEAPGRLSACALPRVGRDRGGPAQRPCAQPGAALQQRQGWSRAVSGRGRGPGCPLPTPSPPVRGRCQGDSHTASQGPEISQVRRLGQDYHPSPDRTSSPGGGWCIEGPQERTYPPVAPLNLVTTSATPPRHRSGQVAPSGWGHGHSLKEGG